MAVFTGSERSGGTPSGQGAKDGNLSIVAAGMRIVGELTTNGVVKIEGVVEGSIRAEQEVLVAKEGHGFVLEPEKLADADDRERWKHLVDSVQLMRPGS